MSKRVQTIPSKVPIKPAGARQYGPGPMLLLLVVVISLLLGGGYLPGRIQFSNDGPLGRLMAQCHHLPDRFFGCWNDLNFVGYTEGAALPGIGFGLQYLLKPVIFSKFYAPLALLILGFGAWCFFRQMGLDSMACILGGLAAALNSGFFSVACWGVAAHPITVGMGFFALAALANPSSPHRWWRVLLAGFAVGMGVTEGADVGAIFSLLIAAFVVYQTLITEGPRTKAMAIGFGRLTLVIVCAIFLSAQAIFQLVVTDIQGVMVPRQAARGVTGRWDWATQWSLPKREALGLVVPGLFGYRMDTSGGGRYWGMMGRDAAWDKYAPDEQQEPPKSALKRFTGSGFYCGVVVVVLAFWSCLQSLRRKNSIFNQFQRKWIWFWSITAVISMLLAFGRFAPFYQLVYHVPYFSTIRNPVKFLYVLGFALVVLFAFGVDAMSKIYMPITGPKAATRWAGPLDWWPKAERFDKRWAIGCLAVLGMSLLAWRIYASSIQSLEQYLVDVQIDNALAAQVAAFSIRQVGWFVIFFVLAGWLMILIFSGAFTGVRAKWGGIWLGLLLVIDLGRANQPWILPVNYKEKYASNPIIDSLREKPCEQRVAMLRFPGPEQVAIFGRLYQLEWTQHLFPYYNIESLDIVQLSRSPKDMEAFRDALDPAILTNPSPALARYWQLTNTRYLMGTAASLGALNQQLGPNHSPFRIVTRFKLAVRPGADGPVNPASLTAVPDPQGPLALFEFTGALPRARLYSHWQVQTNDQATLDMLASASFDPQKTVLVSHDAATNVANGGANQDDGTVEFAGYAPKDIVLESHAAAPSLLLLNDRFDPDWKVQVDGKPETLVRCNFIMRGVFLASGAHTVEFRYQPPIGSLYVSLTAIGLSVVLLGFVVISANRRQIPKISAPVASPPLSQPQAPPIAQRSHARRK